MADFQAEQFKKYDMEQYQKYDTEFCNLHVILPSSHVTILAALVQVQTSNGEVDAFSRIDYYVSNGVVFRPDNATIRGLPMIGTESWNRNIAQKSYIPLSEHLEKLFGRGGWLSKGATVALGNGFWEGEMVFAMDIDMLETQRS